MNDLRTLRIALWATLLFAGQALQIVAATHWHSASEAVASAATSLPQAPADDPAGHDGCLLCQAAAHGGDRAPPPSPWVLRVAHESRALWLPAGGFIATAPLPSHAWQGRAPPQV
jgi:Protein of unknown function (DUF2946)